MLPHEGHISTLPGRTATSELYVYVDRSNPTLRYRVFRSGDGQRDDRPFRFFELTPEGFAAAIAYRDAVLAANGHRTWHRPDFNDLGARAGTFSGGMRDDPHRRYAEALKAEGLIEPYDDVKLADVKPRDLLGTTACMRLAADTEKRDAGRILVPAPIDQDLVDAAFQLHGVLVLVVPA